MWVAGNLILYYVWDANKQQIFSFISTNSLAANKHASLEATLVGNYDRLNDPVTRSRVGSRATSIA